MRSFALFFFVFTLHRCRVQRKPVRTSVFISTKNTILNFWCTCKSHTLWGSSCMPSHVMRPCLISVSSDLQGRERGRMWLPWPHCGDITLSHCVDFMKDSWGVAPGLNCFLCLCVHWCSCALVKVHVPHGVCACVQGRVHACLGVHMGVHVCTVSHGVTRKTKTRCRKVRFKMNVTWGKNLFLFNTKSLLLLFTKKYF